MSSQRRRAIEQAQSQGLQHAKAEFDRLSNTTKAKLTFRAREDVAIREAILSAYDEVRHKSAHVRLSADFHLDPNPAQQIEVAARTVGKMLAKIVNQEDHREFAGLEIIIDPAQPMFDNGEGIMVPGHGPTRYISRRIGGTGSWKGISHESAARYDAIKDYSKIYGKDAETLDRIRDEKASVMDYQAEVHAKERELRLTKEAKAAEATERNMREKRKAAEKASQKERFYEEADTFGLF